jgi:hypothetical protein
VCASGICSISTFTTPRDVTMLRARASLRFLYGCASPANFSQHATYRHYHNKYHSITAMRSIIDCDGCDCSAATTIITARVLACGGVVQPIFGIAVSLERLPATCGWLRKNRCRHVQQASHYAPLQAPGHRPSCIIQPPATSWLVTSASLLLWPIGDV